MKRLGLLAANGDFVSRVLFLLSIYICMCISPIWGQSVADLRVEIRSATGSQRFQVGEVIPLELVFSSSAKGKYLEPCIFVEQTCFGFPVCRFANRWRVSVTPEEGWVNLDRSCFSSSGPTWVIEDHDLTAQPKVLAYELTKHFRFDTPGKYTVRFTTDIGLDDDSNPRPEMFKAPMNDKPERHAVSAASELVLEIVPGDAKWEAEVIRKGLEAYSRPEPRQTNPPSQEYEQYMKDTHGLCVLGTPEAARALAGVLLRGHNVSGCLGISRSTEVAVQEMERLLSDPDAAISNGFFTALVGLKNEGNKKETENLVSLLPRDIDAERERLIAALPQKRGEALSLSLVTVLQNPAKSAPVPFEFPHALKFPDAVLKLAAANFENFPSDRQDFLLTDGWDPIRSPLMLPALRRLAESGNGRALLRWQELDPVGAGVFERAEALRPTPRFSSFYLRLAQPLSPDEEKQLASNFVELAQHYDVSHSMAPHDNLVRVATLLHRYGTRDALPALLPVIKARRSGWTCAVEFPVLAYLLKVSPEDAAPLVEDAVREANHGPCNTSRLFEDLGFLQSAPILERLAFEQLADTPGPFARDAAAYLRRHASPGAKERVRERLEFWQHRSVNATKGKDFQSLTFEEHNVQALASDLADAFVSAQGWIVTAEDEKRLASLLGSEAMKGQACRFACGGKLGVAGPSDFAIYQSRAERNFGSPPIMDYLNPSNPHRYGIRQYGCANLDALKQKLLQFPAGSTFSFAWDFAEADRDEIVEISDFLWGHGYKVRNPQKWSFLRAD